MGKPTPTALPSFSISQLAQRWGMADSDVVDFIATGALQAEILLHNAFVSIGSFMAPPTRQVDGHFPLTRASAAGLLSEEVRSPVFLVEIVLEATAGTNAFVDDVLYPLTRKDVRIGRQEVERLESAATSTIAEAPLSRASQRHRERCRALAALLWEREPSLTIEAMIDRDEIAKFGQEEQCYDRDVVRRWVKDLCPDRKPGRRPNTPRN